MKLKSYVFLCLFLLSTNVFAGGYGSPPPFMSATISSAAKSQTDTENRAFAGLVWTLQAQMSMIPDLTIGFRSLRVKSSDSVNGAEISARIQLKDGLSFDSSRLSYVGGDRDVLGNIGIGYSVTNASWLATLAIQGAYSRLGADYQWVNNKFIPYLEALTVDAPHKKPGISSYACEPSSSYPTLDGDRCLYVPPHLINLLKFFVYSRI